jgi:hypothetical protein
MKRFLIAVFLILPITLTAQSSKWWLYPMIGIDMGGTIPFPLSDIPHGSKGTPKLNPNLGLGFEYKVAGKWNLGAEVSYHVLAFSAIADVRSQPIYFDNHEDILYFSGKTKTDVELRFVEFPVFAVYKGNDRWSLLFGAYYSRILEGTFNSQGINGVLSDNKAITDTASLPGIVNTSFNFNDFIDKWDAGMLIGYRYNLNQRINFWTRLQVGFNSIFVKEFDNIEYELYQVRLNVGISITLFTNRNNNEDG